MSLSRVSERIRSLSNTKVTISATIIFLVFTATVLPVQSEKASKDSGPNSIDTSLFTTVEERYEIAESYGEEGRDAYIYARFTFDLVWPIVYTVFLTSLISWVFTRAFNEGSVWQKSNLIPVTGMMLDYLENISASIVMLRYPARTPFIDLAATLFTPMKWLFVGGSFIALMVGVVKYIVKKISGT